MCRNVRNKNTSQTDTKRKLPFTLRFEEYYVKVDRTDAVGREKNRLLPGVGRRNLLVGIMSTTTENYLTVAVRVARSAGKLIASAFHDSAKQFDTKESFRDLVTATDKEVERRVVDELRESFPHHHFIGEESATGGELLVDGCRLEKKKKTARG